MRKQSSSKPTPNQKEYARQIKRLKGIIARGEKQGYMFDKTIITDKPKRITKSHLNKLANTKSKDLYEKAIWVNYETGEFEPALEKKKTLRQEAARKGHETRKRNRNKNNKKYPNGGNIIADNVIDEFISKLQSNDHSDKVDELIEDMNSIEPDFIPFTRRVAYELERAIEEQKRAKTTILSLTYQVMSEIGKANLGWRLNERSDDVSQLTNYILYGSTAEGVASACLKLANIIAGRDLSFSEWQDISEQEDYNGDYELPQ